MADIDENGIIDNVDGAESKEDEEEAKAVKSLMDEYNEAREFDKGAREQYQLDRTYASGNKQKNWASDANLIGTFIDILVSFLYARDPEVSALAAKNVGGVDQDNVDFAETAGIVISRLWKKGKLKKAARKMVRSTLSVGPGWLKVIMTHETRTDPLIKAKLNDLTDNIERLEFIKLQLDNEDEEELDADDIVVKLREAKQLEKSLNEKLEVIHRSGLAIDFVQADDMQVSLDVGYIDEHLEGDWNGNEIYVLVSDLRRRFKRLDKDDLTGLVTYNQVRPKSGHTSESRVAKDGRSLRYTKADTGAGTGAQFARVIEIWDKRDNHVKTIIEGVKKFAIPPYQPPYATSRFYPYFNLSLFPTDGERHPQSLSSRLEKLQDEYSSKRSNSRLAAERSVPGTIFDSTGVKPEDATKIENSASMEMIGINPMKGDDIRKLFAQKPIPTIDHSVFDTRPVIADMERVSGVQEAQSSAITTQKTATEAKIQESGFNTRTGADRDNLEDMLQDLSEYTLELAIQGMTHEMVVRIAGAEAFWPEEMAMEDIITLAEVEIVAGTTGKPKDEELRQSWSVALPLVQAIMVQIQQAQITGNTPMAVALLALLEETFRRLDERIDVNKFVPQGKPENLAPVVEGLVADSGANVPGAETAPGNAADANTLV